MTTNSRGMLIVDGIEILVVCCCSTIYYFTTTMQGLALRSNQWTGKIFRFKRALCKKYQYVITKVSATLIHSNYLKLYEILVRRLVLVPEDISASRPRCLISPGI
jgi:hypothetical protein